ncbi:MAG TPA: FtsX-like permease family protein, partial [Longimicrobiales bacterium]|nr:FtsX-like permease family protein [Longimicrobiales bacterium]
SWVRFYDVPGVPPPEGRSDHRLEYAAVSPGYFDVMGIGIEQGRSFGPEDGPDGARVAVVSAALARSFWPGESAVGRTLLPASDPDDAVTVVGVAADVKIWTLTEPPRPYLYLPFAQAPSNFFVTVARGPGSPAAVGNAVHEAFRRADPELFVSRIQTMREHLAYILFLPRMAATLVGAFALLALTLATVGLYGVVSYSVAARTREMGIRLSLGADRTSVVALVMRHGLVLTGLGAVVGIVGALVGSRLVSGFLIGVAPWDPVTLVGVPLLLLAVAATAAFVPARRASRIDPSEALRRE